MPIVRGSDMLMANHGRATQGNETPGLMLHHARGAGAWAVWWLSSGLVFLKQRDLGAVDCCC